MPPPWYNVKDDMTEPKPNYEPIELEPGVVKKGYTATIDGRYRFGTDVDVTKTINVRRYYEQKRRAIITELRALDTLLGRKQTIPRKVDRT